MVGMDLALPVPLLEGLHAAAAASADIHFDPAKGTHFDVCSVYDPDQPIDCSCGVPSLLRQLAEAMPLPPGAREPYKPAWAPVTA